MRKELRYKKINNASNIIEINLGNGYSVVVFYGYNKDLEQFEVSMFIKDNEFTTWRMIGAAEKLFFNGDFKTINSVILREIQALNEDNFFDYYIKQYQFEESCLSSTVENQESEMNGNV